MSSIKTLTNFKNVVVSVSISQQLFLKSFHKNTLSFSSIFLKKEKEFY